MKKRAFFITVFCLTSLEVFGKVIPLKNEPVHEAYITNESGQLILVPVEAYPPAPINEKPTCDGAEGEEWISGYWRWVSDDNDFIWVTGLWRKPPHDHVWIKGEWLETAQGWVWLEGFWSSVDQHALTYSKEVPPDLIDEKVADAPGTDFFWIPGYWQKDRTDQFAWQEGRWQGFDPSKVYVPAHYRWRENGYVLVEGYWDYTLDARGHVYAPVAISEDEQQNLTFEPKTEVHVPEILATYFPHWPDYSLLFQTDYFFEPSFWKECAIRPNYWDWQKFWAFNNSDQWALFGWWSHTDYPAPYWLTKDVARRISAPNQTVLELMKNVTPPPIVTARGVVGYATLTKAIEQNTKNDQPVLPNDEDRQKQIVDQFIVQTGAVPRPIGQARKSKGAPDKPSYQHQPIHQPVAKKVLLGNKLTNKLIKKREEQGEVVQGPPRKFLVLNKIVSKVQSKHKEYQPVVVEATEVEKPRKPGIINRISNRIRQMRNDVAAEETLATSPLDRPEPIKPPSIEKPKVEKPKAPQFLKRHHAYEKRPPVKSTGLRRTERDPVGSPAIDRTKSSEREQRHGNIINRTKN